MLRRLFQEDNARAVSRFAPRNSSHLATELGAAGRFRARNRLRGRHTTGINSVAFLARHLEPVPRHSSGYRVELRRSALWLLQSRPITTLLPIWTRKIAAEVIPGLIRPLT